MIAISNKQRDTVVRLLDYLAAQPALDTRQANVRRMARMVARRLRAKQPAKAGGEVMMESSGILLSSGAGVSIIQHWFDA